jgi:hypothetical protein
MTRNVRVLLSLLVVSVVAAGFCTAAEKVLVAAKAPSLTRPEPTNKIDGYTNTPLIPGTKWHVHDPNRPQPKWVQPRFDGTPAAAPKDATVLFDGKDVSKWRSDKWKVVDGYMQCGKGSQVSKDEFGDIQLHLEFLIPAGLKGSGQGQGNSGVYVMGKYEIQVLNSFDNRTYADGQCAAMYGQYPPLVNASRPAGTWQSFDIHFKAPVFKEGKLVSGAYVTVYHNNVLVQDNRAYMGATGWKRVAKYKAHPPKGPISLQAHGSPVRYRNIWVRPLDKKLGPKPDTK